MLLEALAEENPSVRSVEASPPSVKDSVEESHAKIFDLVECSA